MRKFLIIILLVISNIIIAQRSIVDSLKNLLENTNEDTVKVYLLYKISDQFSLTALDTAMQYARKALHLAEEIKYDKGRARSLTRIGNIFSATGDFDHSLDAHFKTLHISDSLKDENGIAASYNNIALVYTNRNLKADYEDAIKYFKKAKQYYEKLRDSANLCTVLLNIGDGYEKLNMLDSAFYFSEKAYKMASEIDDIENLGAISVNLGYISLKRGTIRDALDKFREGVNYMLEADDNHSLSTAWQSMSICFDKLNMPDSSFYYAKKALQMAEETSNATIKVEAAKLLSKLFTAKGKSDSALAYYILANVIDSAINNNDKAARIEQLKLQEQIRNQELEEEEIAAAKKRSAFIEMITIVGFIITFFIGLIILSQKKIHPRAIEVLSVLGLLLVFEFLTFILHSFIGDLTHHSPIYMLAILVGVAALLGPFHHKLTHWLKHKLLHKYHHHHAYKADAAKSHGANENVATLNVAGTGVITASETTYTNHDDEKVKHHHHKHDHHDKKHGKHHSHDHHKKDG